MADIKDLQAYLEANKGIDTVYFNENNDWVFSATNPNYPNAVSREDVLSAKSLDDMGKPKAKKETK